jgi:hypothetical protein
MNHFQRTWRSMSQRRHALSRTRNSGYRENPTDVETSRMIVSRVASRMRLEVSPRRLEILALAMHYGVGAATGVLYGVSRAFASKASQARPHPVVDGAILGSTIFFAADQLAAPALGFQKRELMGRPLFGIASHLIFGEIASVTFDRMHSVLTRSGRTQSGTEIRKLSELWLLRISPSNHPLPASIAM